MTVVRRCGRTPAHLAALALTFGGALLGCRDPAAPPAPTPTPTRPATSAARSPDAAAATQADAGTRARPDVPAGADPELAAALVGLPVIAGAAVRDRFGRLAKNTILAYIDKCLHAPNQIDRKTYGAGLGLYLVANAAASYVVNVAYGIATEVVCTFDRGAKAPLRLVGVFVHPGGAEHLSHGPTPDTANADDGAPAAPGLGE